MNVWENIKLTFKKGDALIKLIYVNVAVFVLLKAVVIVLRLFNMQAGFILHWFAVPADLPQLLHRVWTPISYMFLHDGFFHLFFNMLCLYWFGKIFLSVYSSRHLVGLYFVGGLVAALFYVAAYNIFPYFADKIPYSILLGASGSIMAIVVASAFKLPNMEVRLLLFGGVKLKYIAIVAVLVSFFGITSDNAGGEFAHLGGALSGYLFVALLNKGTDITAWVNRLADWVVNIFRPNPLKVKKGKKTKNNSSYHKMTDEEYNMNKANSMAEIDRILDKIKASGYDSLTADEKRKLFEQGKK
ncbi:rhomboid family intramembrane serine protease [Paludibacter sp. 221]|uniref:rhomboid family protein n=1 Tax=Paludibacter sp. 221 TaxID=2302939 RepID=UPI0013D5D6B2|nr:rhomboid family intramembrane serine protease [Paludibacter sp. 221]NDV47683.1 rhomboid family intramembrane serine protease [Paludibacter sp. 221]